MTGYYNFINKEQQEKSDQSHNSPKELWAEQKIHHSYYNFSFLFTEYYQLVKTKEKEKPI